MKTRLSKKITTIIVMAIAALFTVMNLRLTAAPIKSLVSRETDFAGFVENVESNYVSDDTFMKNQLIDLNGLYARVTGRIHYNNTLKLKNGMLSSTMKRADVDSYAKNIIETNDLCKELGIRFVFVQETYKVDMESTLLPAGFTDYSNECANELIEQLKENGSVEYLDLRQDLSDTPEHLQEYHYNTDHHWNFLGAFVAYQKIAAYINDTVPGLDLDTEKLDLQSWETHILENWSLGSRGRRVGRFYGGLDDVVWYTPDFETSVSSAVVERKDKSHHLRKGDFEDAFIREYYLYPKDLYNKSTYELYGGPNYPLVLDRNSEIENSYKLLIIKDSGANPVQAFLATVFREVDVVDPRHYTGGTIAEYILESKPDMVLMMTNPQAMNVKEYKKFGVKGVLERNYKDLSFEEVWTKDRVAIEAKDKKNNYKTVSKLEPDTYYRLTFDHATVLEGETKGLSIVVYNKTTKKIVSSTVFDIGYYNENGSFSWEFITPDTKDKLQLLVYAGMKGRTNNVGAEIENVLLEKSDY